MIELDNFLSAVGKITTNENTTIAEKLAAILSLHEYTIGDINILDEASINLRNINYEIKKDFIVFMSSADVTILIAKIKDSDDCHGVVSDKPLISTLERLNQSLQELSSGSLYNISLDDNKLISEKDFKEFVAVRAKDEQVEEENNNSIFTDVKYTLLFATSCYLFGSIYFSSVISNIVFLVATLSVIAVVCAGVSLYRASTSSVQVQNISVDSIVAAALEPSTPLPDQSYLDMFNKFTSSTADSSPTNRS